MGLTQLPPNKWLRNMAQLRTLCVRATHENGQVPCLGLALPKLYVRATKKNGQVTTPCQNCDADHQRPHHRIRGYCLATRDRSHAQGPSPATGGDGAPSRNRLGTFYTVDLPCFTCHLGENPITFYLPPGQKACGSRPNRSPLSICAPSACACGRGGQVARGVS